MAKKTTSIEKSKTAKKTAAGKSVKKTRGKDSERESLANELRSLIPQLDSNGLVYLVEQARIHLYNMQVDELNNAAEAANAAAAHSASFSGKAGTGKSSKENFRIIGAESGSSYYLHYRNSEVMFSRDEMIHLVKMVKARGTDLEIRERLYNWFDHERKDVFATVPLADKFDSRLKALVALLKESFKIH